MKGFSVLLLLAAFVYVKCDTLTKEKAIALANDCKDETSATDADIADMLQHEPAASKEAKCLHACVMKKLGVMDADGKMDKDIAKILAQAVAKGDDEKEKLAGEIVDTCADIEVNDDDCEAAAQYGACLKREADAKGIDLSLD